MSGREQTSQHQEQDRESSVDDREICSSPPPAYGDIVGPASAFGQERHAVADLA